mmetsp:Transcript_6315/g.15731  ORF Transcript_6315/g.15731 Transcript_6315/m.15731 type:complete len:239 (-) Transcript_6315:65-781(-)
MYDEDGRDWSLDTDLATTCLGENAEEDGQDPACEVLVRGCSQVAVPGLDRPLQIIESALQLGIAGRIWHAGMVLLAYVADNPGLLRGKRILELGSGTGLVGIACDLLLSRAFNHESAHTIMLTDLTEVVPLLRSNASLNRASAIDVAALHWGETDLDQFHAPVDVVIMSEVAYLPGQFSALANTLAALCDSNTLVLHAYRERLGHLSANVFEELTKRGFTHEEIRADGDATLIQHMQQ